jgi:hydrogenase-4 component B
MIITTYLTSILIILVSGVPALAWGRRSARGEQLSAGLMAGGALLGIVAVCIALAGGSVPELAAAWALPGGHIRFRLDGLAAVFLLPALLISGLGAIYGLGYFPHRRHLAAAGRLRFLYGILAASIAALPACRNGVLFLVIWEVMAIGGFLLILTEQQMEEVRRAAFVYLVSTHAGTLALYAFFTLLAGNTGSFDFPEPGSLDAGTATATAVFLLALFGFGVKAGIMPLHIWLPQAHAAAPSHISALMSGVMIKMGIYGIVRMTSFFADIPPWWGWTILILGIVSGVMGVVFALAQHDIKRLLAYHSVENIGIILIGLGVALLGRSFDQPSLVALGMAGALLHVVNHGLFKSLLFFSAGNLINATGTRQIDSYGGLLKRMPLTGVCFLGGAVAICGLPPLNGFVSEWLIYLGLLHSQGGSGSPLALSMAVMAAPMLAMVGALAVACFVKVFGVTFLGEARKPLPQPIVEASPTMLAPMLIILSCCVIIGIAPTVVVPVLNRALSAWGAGAAGCSLPGTLAPFGWITAGGMMLLIVVAGLILIRHWRKAVVPLTATWGCGFHQPSARMQYTAASFAGMLTDMFHWSLRTEIKDEGEQSFGLFPGVRRYADHTPDLVLDRMLYPACRLVNNLAGRIHVFLQHGVVGGYLLYIAGTLFLLLALVTCSST